MTEQRPDGPARGEAAIRAEIDALVRRVVRAVEDAEGNPHPHHVSARRTGLVQDMVRTALKLLGDGTDLGQAKVMERPLREMRSAYRVFRFTAKKIGQGDERVHCDRRLIEHDVVGSAAPFTSGIQIEFAILVQV